jgi:hypothetical protein
MQILALISAASAPPGLVVVPVFSRHFARSAR